MDKPLVVFALYTLSLLGLTGCAEKSDSSGNDESLIPIIDNGSIAPGSDHPSSNPRYPNLKTYGTINNGFYSVIKAASYTLASDQTLFGGAAMGDALLLALKRVDGSGFKWIDIYEVPKITGEIIFRCKISDFGNF
jgi:hypothetical protein